MDPVREVDFREPGKKGRDDQVLHSKEGAAGESDRNLS